MVIATSKSSLSWTDICGADLIDGFCCFISAISSPNVPLCKIFLTPVIVIPLSYNKDFIVSNFSIVSWLYHLTLSLTGPDKLQKYKKIAIPIVQGYAKSHPEDNKRTMAILKAFGKTK